MDGLKLLCYSPYNVKTLVLWLLIDYEDSLKSHAPFSLIRIEQNRIENSSSSWNLMLLLFPKWDASFVRNSRDFQVTVEAKDKDKEEPIRWPLKRHDKIDGKFKTQERI